MSTPNHSPLLWLTLRVFPPGGHMVRRTQSGTYKICPGSLLTMLGLKPWMHKSAGDFYESLLSWNECNLSRKKKKRSVLLFFHFLFLPSWNESLRGWRWNLAVLLMKPLLRMRGQTGRRNPELTLCRPGNQCKANRRNSSGRAPVWV